MIELSFHFDLAAPEAWLAAERVNSVLGVVPVWVPVRQSALAEPARERDYGPQERDGIERRARELGLQDLRWPARVPADTEWAMLAATWCRHLGRGVAFALAAFRQAFAGGRDLGERDTVLIAAAACELHPAALVKGAATQANRGRLQAATDAAAAAGVRSVPALVLDGTAFHGERAIEAVAEELRRRAVAA